MPQNVGKFTKKRGRGKTLFSSMREKRLRGCQSKLFITPPVVYMDHFQNFLKRDLPGPIRTLIRENGQFEGGIEIFPFISTHACVP